VILGVLFTVMVFAATVAYIRITRRLRRLGPPLISQADVEIFRIDLEFCDDRLVAVLEAERAP
jgi:hypothetical protein